MVIRRASGRGLALVEEQLVAVYGTERGFRWVLGRVFLKNLSEASSSKFVWSDSASIWWLFQRPSIHDRE